MIARSSEKNCVPRLSVIMSVFNGASYLRESIASIQNQSFEDWEFLIMDDGSTDETPDILKGISDSRIQSFSQENSGLTISLNRLLAKVRGEYVGRQDADDISFERRFEDQVSYFDLHPEIGLLGTWAVQIDESGDKLDEIKPVSTDEDIRAILPFENPFVHASIIVRTSQVRAVGGYREEFKYSQDYDFLLRVSEKTKLANLESMLCAKRHNPNMLSVKNNSEQKFYAELARETWRERRENGKDSIDFNEYIRPTFNEKGINSGGQINYHQHLISAWIRKGECQKARREIRSLLRLSPFSPSLYAKYLFTYLGSTFVNNAMLEWDRVRSSDSVKK